ncbi:MAG: alpha-amylase/4-alpha-glucanotransferase domain-containing protein [Pseudomonadota bacterium]
MSVRLVFALHFHQPIGNFDSVFEDALAKCYAPIVEAFERHPKVRAAFHLSGCLLEWLESHHPKFLDRVYRLVSSGQVEPLGGGFYEPILSVIPREDALRQIALLNAFWKSRVGITPQGAWLSERVWEPGLAELLSEGGIRYTILDDQHLRFAGIVRDRMTGLFVTERFGKALAFFPSDYKLRYLIPFRPIDRVREHFDALAEGSRETILTYGDDAEKFGLWPGTHQWVFVEKWLEQFFLYLEEENAPVRSVQPGEIFRLKPPAEKVYIPNAAYSEMLEWALPFESVPAYTKLRDTFQTTNSDEAVKSFVRGSLWDMFLARYPESNQMLKHVIRTSTRVRALPEGKAKKRAYPLVLRAQCNCAYWHGLFGGIYLPHLRHGVYQNVIEADSILLGDLGSKTKVEVEDYDGDLEEEIIVSSKTLQAFFRPGDAGTMAELDFLPSRYNVTNLVSRWKESYHSGNDITHSHAASDGPASPHELSVGIRPSDLANATFDELPLRSLRDFHITGEFDPHRFRKWNDVAFARGRMERWATHAAGWSGHHAIGSLRYGKEVRIHESNTLACRWTVDPTQSMDGTFGTLFAFTLLTPDAADRRAEVEDTDGPARIGKPGDEFDRPEVTRVTWEDFAFGFGFDLTFSVPPRMVSVPIRTFQRSEKGYEAVYQGTLLAALWPVSALLGDGVTAGIRFRSLVDRREK